MRKSYWQLVLLGSILLVGIATTDEARPPPPPPLPPPPPPGALFPEYQFLVLAQTWAPTLCRNPSSNCPKPVPNRFTIHGLWPATRRQTLESCCTTPNQHTDCPFNYIKASNNNQQTLRDLQTEWPNLYNRDTNTDFLMHEWNKHGTCSLRYLTQTSYFQNALRLFRASDLGTAILTSPEFKNRMISIANLKAAVRKKTNSAALVVCNSNNQLLEVRVCTDVNGCAFKDCGGLQDSCNSTTVTLPLPAL